MGESEQKKPCEGASSLLRRVLSLCAGLAILALGLYALDIGCVFRFVTGVPCPGCGMTRAWLAALCGDLAAAVAYHPLFWAVPAAFALVFAQERLPRGRRVCVVAAGVLVAAFVVLWGVRLMMPADAGLFFGGTAPAGVPADVISIERPRWFALLAGLIG